MTANSQGIIDSDDLTIGKILEDFYTVPDFQREYVWEPEHVERLLQDVLDEFYDESGKPTQGVEYFIGSIIVCSDEEGVLQLIDGQQRLTTIYLALCVIRDRLKQLDKEPPNALTNEIRASKMHPTSGQDIPRYRVTLQYEDSQGILESIAEGVGKIGDIKRTTRSVRNLIAAYETIDEFLSANFNDDTDRIMSFMATLVNRVKLVRIVTPDLSRALKVFETINARGKGLDPVDLLKNLLFIESDASQYAKLKTSWKAFIDTLFKVSEKPLRFLRYYVMAEHEYPANGLPEDKVYDWFRANLKKTQIGEDPLGFMDRLAECGRVYANFLRGKDREGNLNPFLSNISYLSGVARQHLILLLAGRHLSHDLFLKLSREVENVFFCYLFTREQSKTFERNFASWARHVKAIENAGSLADFCDKYLHPELASRAKTFDFNFQQLTLSNIQRYRMRYILAKMTQFVDEAAFDVRRDLNQYMAEAVHIEHILPENPRKDVRAAFDIQEQYGDWAQRLGNLTLLERTINTSLSNASYREKCPGYMNSMFLLTKSLVERPNVGVNTRLNRAVADLLQFDKWDSTTIELRQQMLVRLALQVWLRDGLPAEVS